MKLEIVTPERRLEPVEATEVVAPGQAGEFGVLLGHKPFLTSLGTGVLTYQSEGRQEVVMVSGGLCEVLEDRITVLAEYVQPAGEIDLSEAKRKAGELEQRLDSLPADSGDRASVGNKLERMRARVSAASIKR